MKSEDFKMMEESYPGDFKMIHKISTGPSAIKTLIGAFQVGGGRDDFRTMPYANTHKVMFMVDEGHFTF